MADQDMPAGGIDIYGSGFRVDVNYDKAIEGARQLDKLLTGIPTKVEAAVNKSLATITGMISQVNSQLTGVGVGSGGGGTGSGGGGTDFVAAIPTSRPKTETRDERSRSARAGVNIFDGITTPASASSAGRQIRGANRGTYSEVPLIGPVQPYSQPTAPRGPGPITPMSFEMYGGNYRGRAQRLDYDHRRRAEIDAAYWSSRTMPPQLLPANITPYTYRPSDPRDPSHFQWPSGPNMLDRLVGEYGAFGQTTRPVHMQGRRDDEGLAYVGGGGPARFGMPGGGWTTDQRTARMAQGWGAGLVHVGGPAQDPFERQWDDFTRRAGPMSSQVGIADAQFRNYRVPLSLGERGIRALNWLGGPTAPRVDEYGRPINRAANFLRGAAYVGAAAYGAQRLAYGAAGLYRRTVGAAATEHQGRILLAETMVGGEVGLDFDQATLLANQLVDTRVLGSIGLSPAALGLNRAELADQYRQLAPIIRLNATNEGQFREGLESGTLARQLLVTRDPAQGTRGAMIALSELYSGGQDRFTSLSRRFELPRARMLEIEAELNATGAYYDPSRIVLQVLSEMGFTEEYARARALGTVQGQFSWTSAMASNVGLDAFSGTVNPLIETLNTLNRSVEMFTTSQSYVDMMSNLSEGAAGFLGNITAAPLRWATTQSLRGAGLSPWQFSAGLSGAFDPTGSTAADPYYLSSGAETGSAWDVFATRAAELFAERATTLMAVSEAREGGSSTLGTSVLGALGLSMGLGALGRGLGYQRARADGMGVGGALARAGGNFMATALPLAALTVGIEAYRDSRRNVAAADMYGSLGGRADELIFEYMMADTEGLSAAEVSGRGAMASGRARRLEMMNEGNWLQRNWANAVNVQSNFVQWRDNLLGRDTVGSVSDMMYSIANDDALVNSLAANMILQNPGLDLTNELAVSRAMRMATMNILGDTDTSPERLAELTSMGTNRVMEGQTWNVLGQSALASIVRESADRGVALDFSFGGVSHSIERERMLELAGDSSLANIEADVILDMLKAEGFTFTEDSTTSMVEQFLGADSEFYKSMLQQIEGNTGDVAAAMRGDGLRLSNQPNVFLGYDPNADWRNVNPVRGGLFGEVLSEAVTPHQMAQGLMARPTMGRLNAALSPYATTVTGQSLGAPIPTLGAAANLAGRTPSGNYDSVLAAQAAAMGTTNWIGLMGGTHTTMAPGQNYPSSVLAKHPYLANVNAAGGHSGIDLRIGDQGVSDPFLNPFGSTLVVVDAGDTGEKGRGKWATYYNPATGNYWQASHLDEMLSVGANIAPGEILGMEGTTGSSTGYHLDWRMVSQAGTSGLGNINAWGDVRDVNRGGLGAFSQAMLNEGLWAPDANTPPADTFSQGGDVNLHVEVHGGGTAEENAMAFRREIHNMQRDGVFNALAEARLHEYARRGLNADGTNPTEQPSIANGGN